MGDDFSPYDYEARDELISDLLDRWASMGDDSNTTQIKNEISFTGGGEEMLRISKDGFYIRGERVPADKKEAQAVYTAFKQWLNWAILNGQFKK